MNMYLGFNKNLVFFYNYSTKLYGELNFNRYVKGKWNDYTIRCIMNSNRSTLFVFGPGYSLAVDPVTHKVIL
jgi:hypothetical protein